MCAETASGLDELRVEVLAPERRVSVGGFHLSTATRSQAVCHANAGKMFFIAATAIFLLNCPNFLSENIVHIFLIDSSRVHEVLKVCT